MGRGSAAQMRAAGRARLQLAFEVVVKCLRGMTAWGARLTAELSSARLRAMRAWRNTTLVSCVLRMVKEGVLLVAMITLWDYSGRSQASVRACRIVRTHLQTAFFANYRHAVWQVHPR